MSRDVAEKVIPVASSGKNRKNRTTPGVGFVFSGLGKRYDGMGEDIREIPEFKSESDAFREALRDIGAKKNDTDFVQDPAAGHMETIRLQLAMVRMLSGMGVVPDAVVGHSAGEAAAARTCGVLTLKETARLVAAHARVIRWANGRGGMLFAAMDTASAKGMLTGRSDIWLTAENGPKSVVFTGTNGLSDLAADLAARGIFVRRLAMEVPFHCRILDPKMAAFATDLTEFSPQNARIPLWSSLTGGRVEGSRMDARHWKEHILTPIRFQAAIADMIAQGIRVFIEIGPHPALQMAITETAKAAGVSVTVLETLQEGRPATECFARLIRGLQDAGVSFSVPRGWKEIEGVLSKKTNDNSIFENPEQQLSAIVKEALTEASLGKISDLESAEDGFLAAGMTSVMALRFRERICDLTGFSLPATLVFDYPDPQSLLSHLASLAGKPLVPEGTRPPPVRKGDTDIAIVGMGCRFPGGCDTPSAYWELLCSGNTAFGRLPEDRFSEEAFTDGDPDHPGTLQNPTGAFLDAEKMWGFDAGYFRLPAKEIHSMDPQHRILLETTVEAFSNAGIPDSLLKKSRTGVFIGMATDDYKTAHIAGPDLGRIDLYAATGGMFSAAAGRIAHFFDLNGPVLSIDTACSSALVAVHQAASALQNGEADLCIAGGVNAILSPNLFVTLDKMGILSPSGHCRVFDAEADGYIRGEGCGVVVLKRLCDAQKNGDRIRGIIRGSAVNHDGRSASLTAPNGKAQEAVIRTALAVAGKSPSEVRFIEAHGTGTRLGDPVEMGALARVFAQDPVRKTPLYVGSAKSVIGHLEPAAGMAGLIKAVLCLEKGRIPGQTAFHTPNPEIPELAEETGLLKVCVTHTDLAETEPVVAGVSSFGFSGTNAHLVLEKGVEAPRAPAMVPPMRILPVSAHSKEAFSLFQNLMADHLDSSPETFDGICHFFAKNRSFQGHKKAIVARNAKEAAALLRRATPVRSLKKKSGHAFLFTGQGGQMPRMAEPLYHTNGAFRSVMDTADSVLEPVLGRPLSGILYGTDPDLLCDTAIAQPALFAVAMGMVAVWEDVAVRPDLVMGHSLGELMAACTAGIFDLKDGLLLAARRGEAMAAVPGNGGMAAVQADATTVSEILGKEPAVVVAGLNGEEQTVISGEKEAVFAICQRFASLGIQTRPLAVSHAFHSSMMQPAADRFLATISSVSLKRPKIPVISNLTGEIDDGFLTDPGYWHRQMLHPVRFAEGVACLATHCRVVTEIGPKPVLIPMARKCLGEKSRNLHWVMSWDSRSKTAAMEPAMGAAWEAGVTLDWERIYPGMAEKPKALPPFPFVRKPYGMPHVIAEPVKRAAPEENEAGWAVSAAKTVVAPDASEVADLYAMLDRIAELRVLSIFAEQSGVPPRTGIFRAALATALDLADAKKPLFDALCHQLLASGLMKGEETLYWEISSTDAMAQAEDRERELASLYPDMVPVADLVARATTALADVLADRICPLGVLFPEGRMDLVACVYRDHRVADFFNDVVAACVKKAVQTICQRTPSCHLTFLEIGAGTGATTDRVLPVLKEIAAKEDTVFLYQFTDVSPVFGAEAGKRYGDPYPFVTCHTLDMEEDPAEQGFSRESCDMVLATGVLHATEDLNQTLCHARSLLKPEGLLIINEPVQAFSYLTPVFGLTEGWWRFGQDPRRIPASPLIAADMWPAILSENGFHQTEWIPMGEVGTSPQLVMVTAKDPGFTKSNQSGTAMNRRISFEEENASLSCSISPFVALVSEASGIPEEELDPDLPFFELGVDSLMLVKIRQELEARFGVSTKMGQFYEKTDTLRKLAFWVEEKSRKTIRKSPVACHQKPVETLDFAGNVSDGDMGMVCGKEGDLSALMATQLATMQALMEKQLAVWESQKKPEEKKAAASVSSVTSPQEASPHFRLFHLSPDALDKKQADYLSDFTKRFTAKTAKSLALAERFRPVLSDWINSLGFRTSIKTMVYPVVMESAGGARFTDIDGNTYIDMAMGYGVSFFGSSPSFIRDAVSSCMTEGWCLGPQTKLAGEVAAGIRALTGVERVAFCNTGSEAVMAALRIARTVTGRKTVVLFSGSYHGTFDGVLAADLGDGSVPAAPGTLAAMVADVVVLPYGAAESLDRIRALGEEMAAVLVEPVQSRNPSLQPGDFLQKLQRITKDSGTALIFDEVLTGFRIHPGGCQAWFGVTADIVTYGKIIGGGMPIGIVAGKSRYLDAVDGGIWQFGDDSAPEDRVTTFAGTFCKHPMALAAARAVLRELSIGGPALQEGVNRLTADLAMRVNDFCRRSDFALRVRHFGSVFRFEPFGRYSLATQPLELEIFFRLLMEKGIYTWEKRICFLSAAHTKEDVDTIVCAIKESLREMREGGFVFSGTLLAEEETTVPKAPYPVPMTAAQTGLYYFRNLPGGEAVYHVNGAWTLDGPLRVNALAGAFRDLICRHDALRMAFFLGEDGRAMMQPVSDAAPEILVTSCREDEITDKIDAFIRPFDLTTPPMIRVMIAKIAENRHLLVVDTHHIAVDGLSLSRIVREVTTLYRGEILPVVPPFSDVAQSEEAYRKSGLWQRDLAFWKERLTPPAERFDIPGCHPRPPEMEFAGKSLCFTWNEEKTKQMQNTAKQMGVSPFALLFGLFRILQYRLTGMCDCVIGVPVGGRASAGFDSIIGMFANAIGLRIPVTPDETVSALCKRIAKESLAAMEHGRIPFEDVVAHLMDTRDSARNPVFDTMFIYEEGTGRQWDFPDLTVTDVAIHRNTAMFDLTFEAVRVENRMEMRMEYRTSLFTDEMVDRLQKGWDALACQVMERPDLTVQDLGLLDPAAQKALLRQWNPPFTQKGPSDLVSAIGQMAAVDPSRPALVAGPLRLTHGELEAATDAVAAWLQQEMGVKSCDRVGILCHRDPFLVPGILGILKAGAAYVPADPRHPENRIRMIMEDAGVSLLLTGPDVPVPEIGVKTARLSSVRNTGSQTAYTRVFPLPEQEAYLMYTSGSTGRPKGVRVSHGNAAVFCRNLPERFGMGPDTRMLAVTTVTFDISVLELIGTLAAGGCVVLADEGTTKDPDRLLELMEQESVTAFQTTPSLYTHLLTDGKRAKEVLASCATLLVGGEALPASLRERLAALPGVAVFNVYGPTEATIWATAKQITKEDNTVGTPLVNAEILITGPDNQVQPQGICGEIAIGGDGVSLGYVDLPEKTADRFIPHPLFPDRRIYRTGDMGYWREDGELVCLGRMDDQVKVRGFRVETGEVAAALMRYPGIRQAAVRVRNPAGVPVLCAWLTGEEIPEDGQLHDYLAADLPDYMIPAVFTRVPAIPLSPSGKMDVANLPDPCGLQKETEPQPFLDPLLRKKVETIWETVLNRSSLSETANFFALGGDSIRAVRMVGLFAKAGLSLTVQDIFRHPTIHALCTALATTEGKTEKRVQPEIMAGANRRKPEGDTLLTTEDLAMDLGADELDDLFDDGPAFHPDPG